ncbi:MAG: ABC transporter permease [Fimbriimonadaceae bacterium]|nr:ABC transporter permease [Fimbriimonadaceae bacterium]
MRRPLLRFGWAACLCLAALSRAQTDEESLVEYRKLRALVSPDEIARTYREVDAFGGRFPGSEGERRAMDYAEERFRALGYQDIVREPFKVTVPDPEATGRFETKGGRLTILPMWPNLVRTSTCDVEGPVVYVGRGSLEELNGKTIDGAIVLLEVGGGANWKAAAALGAKAILFLEPAETSRAEVDRTYLNVPIRTPRFWVPIQNAKLALDAARNGDRARIVCRQDWVVRESCNLVVNRPAGDPKFRRERVVLFGYLDSMSVVPKLAPGAEAIGNLALMLETARIWRDRSHRRPIQYVVSGAHSLALQGAREFVAKRLESTDNEQILTLTLDITGGSRALGSYAEGYFYDYRWEAMDPVRQMSRTLRLHADQYAKVEGVAIPRMILTDAVNNSDNRTWKNNIPGRFAFDCEPFTMGGYNALTLATIEDSRERVDTPFDRLDRVDLANVARQARTLTVMLWHVLNDPTEARGDSRFRVALTPTGPSRMRLTGGFARIEGRVVEFDPNQSFIPDISQPNSLVVKIDKLPSYMGVRANLIAMTEGDKAEFRLEGLVPINAYPWWMRDRITVSAFRVNPASGEIERAIQQGSFASEEYHSRFELKTSYKSTSLVVFPCVAIDLFDLVDPKRLVALQFFNVFDARDDGPPLDYGFFKAWKQNLQTSEVEDTAVLFTPPELRWKLLMSSDFSPSLVLVNSTKDDPDGAGYLAPGASAQGRPIGRATITLGGRMPNLPLQVARDIVSINQDRMDRFAKYRIVGQGVDELQSQARDEMRLAEEAEGTKTWSAVKRHARAAWGLALRAHPVLQKTAGDVVNGVLFYLFLLIPFSYYVERLVFGNRMLVRQLLVSIAIFIGSFLLLRYIHPAFEIVENPFMIFIAFVMGVLSLIVIAFILGKFESSLKTLKQTQSGIHEVDIGRTSVAMAAFNLGISNMRRRKARTFLTTLTLVVMTFIVLSFTSIVPELAFNEVGTDFVGSYPGVLVRGPGLEPLESSVYKTLENEYHGKATIVRRAWYYGADIQEQSNLTLSRADRSFDARGLVGLDPGEAKVTRADRALLPGGRWFEPGEGNVVILPQPVADQLKVAREDVGKASVLFAGVPYTVIGILDTSELRGITDLDGEVFLPADFTLSNRMQSENQSLTEDFREFIRLDPATVFFIPADRALALGADIRSVAVGFADPNATRPALKKLMPRLTMNLYAAVPNESDPKGPLQVRRFSAFHRSKGTGLGLVIVQMLIAAVFVFNTMVASVFERKREISIFSSIGLAPNHIAMLFFAESLVYGVLGAVFGYFAAQIAAKVIVATGSFQGLYLNFSSVSAVLSAGIVMAIVLLSTIYPAKVASKIAAPALNEAMWDTDPDGDEWDLQLPFSVNANEAMPLVEFLGEWFRAYEEYTIGTFVTSETTLYRRASEFGDAFCTETTAWVAPYDLGVSQRLVLSAVPTALPDVVQLRLHLSRLSGEPENWVNVNRRFLTNLRKQFLTWRTLEQSQRAEYGVRASVTFAAEPVPA